MRAARPGASSAFSKAERVDSAGLPRHLPRGPKTASGVGRQDGGRDGRGCRDDVNAKAGGNVAFARRRFYGRHDRLGQRCSTHMLSVWTAIQGYACG